MNPSHLLPRSPHAMEPPLDGLVTSAGGPEDSPGLRARTDGSGLPSTGVPHPADMAEEIAATASAQDAVEGVTLERYVLLSDELARRSLVGQQAIDEWLRTQGVPPGAWTRIAAGWSLRMARFPAIRDQYSACVRARRAATVRIELPEDRTT